MDWKPLSLKSAQSGNDVIVNAESVVSITPIGGKAAPTSQVLFVSGHNVLFLGSPQEISAEIAAAMAGQPQPKPATNLPPDLQPAKS